MRVRRLIGGVGAALALALALPAAGAERVHGWRLGAAAAYGSQAAPPLGNRNYVHDAWTMKLIAARPLLTRGAFALELSLEPFTSVVRHRLRNPWFLKPSPGVEADRARFTRGETFQEVGLDVGLVARWALTRRLSVLAMGSIGPMWGDAGTERLAEGFAFSDIIAAGVGWRAGDVLLELRPGFRHVSNAYLKRPNSGHNAMFVLMAVTVERG